MNKQEKIREMTKRIEVDRILIRYTGRTGADLNVVKRELSEAGVVIKVDRELPDSPWGFNADNGLTEARILTRGYYCAEHDMLMAGYVAVEPLVKVSK